MKIRMDFVTNSSSSSFVVMNITNATFAKIVQKYEEIWGEDDCINVMVFDDTVEINVEEGYLSVPSSKNEIIDTIIECLDVYGIAYEDFEDEDFEDEDCANFINFIKEIKESEKEIMKSMEYFEVEVSDMGWQGDSDSRYYKENYSEEELKNVYSEIAREKEIDVSEVTDEDFNYYVSDKTSIERDSFTYTSENDKIECNHSFELE